MSWLQRWWAPLSAIAVIFVSVVIVVCFWDWLGGKEKGPSDIIRNTGLIVAAVVAIILAVWRSDIAQKQTEGASRSLREEQYKTAVEMLGNCQLFVRVGAIDTLTQLAETYPNDFHLRVVRLLAAFVRHPPNSSVSYLPYGAREETQRILVFIANRSQKARTIEEKEDCIIDLQGANLSGIWLRRGDCLARVRLSYCNLSGAVLNGVCGLTENQLLGTFADPKKPANFNNTVDCQIGKPLTIPISPLG